MFKITNSSWNKVFSNLRQEDWYIELERKVAKEYDEYLIHPQKDELFRAFNLCDYNKCKVVIIGQDPYFNIGEANGLAFSVNDGVKFPPSLRNIFTELSSDLNIKTPNSGDLSPWAKQGVLLINSILSVRNKQPRSHHYLGWDKLTDFLISYISNNHDSLVFILWGNDAIKKEELINKENNHLLLKSPHPSPLSSYRGFFGSRPFSKTNVFLLKNSKNTIDWDLYL